MTSPSATDSLGGEICRWPVGPAEVVLREGETHVWGATLDHPPDRIRQISRILDAEETERANRYLRPIHRDRFTVARVVLRTLLGGYLQTEPSEIRFTYGPQGKPALGRDRFSIDLHFNVSHSRALGLFAVSRGREIGVDVERIDPRTAVERLAERFFSARENEMLEELPVDLRREAFFRCWTRKEAYIKARGEGLFRALRSFDVSLAPAGPAELLGSRPDAEEVSRWSMYDLAPAPGYAAALVAEVPSKSPSCWTVGADLIDRVISRLRS